MSAALARCQRAFGSQPRLETTKTHLSHVSPSSLSSISRRRENGALTPTRGVLEDHAERVGSDAPPDAETLDSTRAVDEPRKRINVDALPRLSVQTTRRAVRGRVVSVVLHGSKIVHLILHARSRRAREVDDDADVAHDVENATVYAPHAVTRVDARRRARCGAASIASRIQHHR